MTVADPRLAQIRALCDYADRGLSEGPTGWVDTVDIRAVLDAPPVAVTPPQGDVVEKAVPNDEGVVGDGYGYELGGGWYEVSPQEFMAASARGEEIAETRRGKPLTTNYEHRYWVRRG